MPKSKTRVRPVQRSAAPPRPTGPATLSSATLALTQAAVMAVREAELEITNAARTGGDTAQALEVHHYLRTATLGLLVAHSKLAGLPDPRSSAPGVAQKHSARHTGR